MTPPAPRHVLLALLAALGLVFLAVLAAPLLLSGSDLTTLWWAVAALGAVACLGLGAAVRHERLLRAAAPPPAPTVPGSSIDFDRPWRGGAP
jgi:hypothetical protein